MKKFKYNLFNSVLSYDRTGKSNQGVKILTIKNNDIRKDYYEYFNTLARESLDLTDYRFLKWKNKSEKDVTRRLVRQNLLDFHSHEGDIVESVEIIKQQLEHRYGGEPINLEKLDGCVDNCGCINDDDY